MQTLFYIPSVSFKITGKHFAKSKMILMILVFACVKPMRNAFENLKIPTVALLSFFSHDKKF